MYAGYPARNVLAELSRELCANWPNLEVLLKILYVESDGWSPCAAMPERLTRLDLKKQIHKEAQFWAIFEEPNWNQTNGDQIQCFSFALVVHGLWCRWCKDVKVVAVVRWLARS